MSQHIFNKRFGYVIIFIALLLIAYPLLYYAYKFYNPNLGGIDFYYYYPLYKDFDISKVEAPFNMRLVGSFFVYLLSKSGFYYDAVVSFHNENINQKIFFNAIFVNWLSVVITLFLLFRSAYMQSKTFWFAFAMILIFLTGFGTLFFLSNPTSDGFSVLLITITYILYKQKNILIYLLYVLLLFQREFAFIIFGILAFIDFIYSKEKFYLYHFGINIFLFLTYIILRKTLFYTPLCSLQIRQDTFINSIFYTPLDLWAFCKQVFLSQNIYFLYCLVALLNYRYQLSINKKHLYTLIIFIILTFLISRIAVANNNMSRFLYMFVPILILEMIVPELLKLKAKLPTLFS